MTRPPLTRPSPVLTSPYIIGNLRRWVALKLGGAASGVAAADHRDQSPGQQPPSPARSYPLLSLGVAAAVITVDAVTKALAVRLLPGRGTVHVGGVFALELYRNHVGARNAFRGHPLFASLLALAAVIAILLAATRARTAATAVATGLMLGGGVGNLLDRLLEAPGPLRGGVIHWLRTPWSTGSMNLADLAIYCGVLTLLIGGALTWRADRRRASHTGHTARPCTGNSD